MAVGWEINIGTTFAVVRGARLDGMLVGESGPCGSAMRLPQGTYLVVGWNFRPEGPLVQRIRHPRRFYRAKKAETRLKLLSATVWRVPTRRLEDYLRGRAAACRV